MMNAIIQSSKNFVFGDALCGFVTILHVWQEYRNYSLWRSLSNLTRVLSFPEDAVILAGCLLIAFWTCSALEKPETYNDLFGREA